MATSNSSNWTATRNEIIRSAALKCRAIGTGVTMSDQMLQDFDHALNALVKSWQASGIHVWTVQEATLFPQSRQIKYALATAGADHCTQTYYETALSADEASGQTVLSVDSTTNMTVADYIGIVVDDGTIHWSTIASKTSTTVTINAALDDDAAAGAAVFTYTTKIVRPLKIVAARRFDYTSDNETPLVMVSRLDYQDLANKVQAGTINQAFYDPQLSTGYLNLYQVPEAITDLVNFTWHRPIQDFDTASDNPDLPVEWVRTLEWNLALEKATEFPISDSIYRRIVGMAASTLDLVKDFDREEGSLFVQPDTGW